MCKPTDSRRIGTVNEMPLEKLDPLFVDQLKELKHKLFDVPREKKLIHLQEE